MKRLVATLLTAHLCLSATTVRAEGARLFLFVGEPNNRAWRTLIDNPQDREAAVSKAVARLGGKILSYHFGLGDGRNYVIVQLPDDNTLIQAMYVARFGDDLLKSYTMTELLSSADMAKALKRVEEVKAAEQITHDADADADADADETSLE